MKKLFFLVLLTLSVSVQAAYYVAGNGNAGSVWCDGKTWDPAGCQMTASGTLHSITFSNVPIGNYKFKVTNGTWSVNFGYANLDETCSNIMTAGDGDGNVVFDLLEAQNVTITFDGSHICLTGDGNNPGIDSTKLAKVAVPAECEDVMLQAFYWDSNSKTTYGGKNTRWTNLMADTAAIGHDFDLVWFPPATGGRGVGYYATSYSFQTTSAWGTKAELKALIAALKASGTKALADIVINHRQSTSGWAKSFGTDDFGGYGSFTLTSEHICSDDEAKTDASSDSRNLTFGNPDTGNGDGGCRDLDHTNPYVQDMCKAYTRWMMDSIGFEGFRYDMVIGFQGQYLSEYNLCSQPYLSVAEYWESLDRTVGYLKSTLYNTMVFDFPLKYSIKDAINNGSYAKLTDANGSLRGKGLGKYAVTFVDNHDTYERNNQNELVTNIKAANAASKVLRANAFILMMPGVPCVFYPHWKTYQSEISAMIALRKMAGIHSESLVTDESAGSQSYTATIHGHRGNVVLRMGSRRDTNTPAGYVKKMSGSDMDIYLSSDCVDNEDCQVVTALEEMHSTSATKVMENGKVYLIVDGVKFDILGNRK